MADDGIDGQDGSIEDDAELTQVAHVQAPQSGGTMVANRGPHPNAAMEERFKEAENLGWIIEERHHGELGRYFLLVCACDPGHLGTVNEKEIYSVVIEKILKRCPEWREWKKKQERKEGT